MFIYQNSFYTPTTQAFKRHINLNHKKKYFSLYLAFLNLSFIIDAMNPTVLWVEIECIFILRKELTYKVNSYKKSVME